MQSVIAIHDTQGVSIHGETSPIHAPTGAIHRPYGLFILFSETAEELTPSSALFVEHVDEALYRIWRKHAAGKTAERSERYGRNGIDDHRRVDGVAGHFLPDELNGLA